MGSLLDICKSCKMAADKQNGERGINDELSNEPTIEKKGKYILVTIKINANLRVQYFETYTEIHVLTVIYKILF